MDDQSILFSEGTSIFCLLLSLAILFPLASAKSLPRENLLPICFLIAFPASCAGFDGLGRRRTTSFHVHRDRRDGHTRHTDRTWSFVCITRKFLVSYCQQIARVVLTILS